MKHETDILVAVIPGHLITEIIFLPGSKNIWHHHPACPGCLSGVMVKDEDVQLTFRISDS